MGAAGGRDGGGDHAWPRGHRDLGVLYPAQTVFIFK